MSEYSSPSTDSPPQDARPDDPIQGDGAPEPAPRSRRGSRRGHRRTRNKALIAVLVAMLALGGIAAAGMVGVNRIYERLTEGTADFDGPPQGEQVVRITAGSSIRAIGRTLAEAGVVQTEGAFVAAARDESRASTLQPGTYRLQRQMPAAQALDLLLDPSARILARIAIPEGSNVEETVQILARESGLEAEAFQDVLDKPAGLGLPGWAEGPQERRAEGFLFPATYDVEPDATAESVLAQMTRRFERAATETDLVARAADVGRSAHEVLTIASLVEAEARLPVDMPKVARVVYNRLEEGMKLQFDSTVHFANGGAETITTSAQERAIDSPYNTYRYEGLPPGPINSPGQAAIEAALAPEQGDWLYFVTVNPDTGETRYGRTGAEHAANVAVFQQWLRQNPQ